MAKAISHLCCIFIFLSILSLIAVSTCEKLILAEERNGAIPDQIPAPTWCIASASATDAQLQGFVDFACGQVDCHLIQPGEACYEPNTARGHGSWCLDAYYRTHKECSSLGTIVYKDPSYGDCLYI